MNIKKISGALAVVATLLLANVSSADPYVYEVQECPVSTVIRTDRDALIGWIEEFARFTRCVDYPRNTLAGQWNPDDPVWEHRPKQDGNGCEVHWKLSKLLNEENDSGGTKRKGKNGNRGAASNLAGGKDLGAIDSLLEYIATIEDAAKVRKDDHEIEIAGVMESHNKDVHQLFADNYADEADNILGCIDGLKD